MGAVLIRRATSVLAVVGEVIVRAVLRPRQCVMSQNAQTREASLELRLQRIIAVVRAVAVEVNTLSPSVTIKERFAKVRVRLREVTNRLIDIKRRTIASKHVSAFVAYVTNFDRGILFKLVL